MAALLSDEKLESHARSALESIADPSGRRSAKRWAGSKGSFWPEWSTLWASAAMPRR